MSTITKNISNLFQKLYKVHTQQAAVEKYPHAVTDGVTFSPTAQNILKASQGENLDEVKGKIGKYFDFIKKIPIDNKNKEKGAQRLAQFLENVDIINQKHPDKALSIARYKLSILQDFEQYYPQSTNLKGYFKEAFYGIYNIGIMNNEGLIRNSQPSYKDFKFLAKEMGVKSVINLRAENKYWEGYTKRDEERICKENGMEYRSYNLEDKDNQLPTKEELDKIMNNIDTLPKPVMFHCAHGKGRTGIVAAVYRLSREGWKYEDAVKEAIHYGFDPDKNPKQAALIKGYEKK